jgi:hypothetical protein
LQHVIEAMRAGTAVRVGPARPELPINEATHAIGMDTNNLRAYVAEGAISFRSAGSVDWVRLEDAIEFNRRPA